MPAETVEGAIVSRLAGDAATTAIIGTTPIAPASDPTPRRRPRLYFQTINGTRPMTNDGPVSLTQTLIFYYASADDMLTAKRLAKAVKNRLEAFSGTIGEINIRCIRIAGPIDEPAELAPGQMKTAQRVRLELTVDWQ